VENHSSQLGATLALDDQPGIPPEVINELMLVKLCIYGSLEPNVSIKILDFDTVVSVAERRH
jgi:hypothetical protein